MFQTTRTCRVMFKIRLFSILFLQLCLSSVRAFTPFHRYAWNNVPVTGIQRGSGEVIMFGIEGDLSDEEKKGDKVSISRNDSSLDSKERTWRYVKKPLLRIGAKGCSKSHGNSLRQLLADHIVVKVKVNTNKYGGLDDIVVCLVKLAEEAGAPTGIEYIQSRDIERTILLGMPGTLSLIESGNFPPIDSE